MADLEDIVQNVAISGTDDITSAFRLLATSVESSVSSIQSYIESSFTEVVTQGGKVKTVTTELGENLSQLAGIAGAAVAGFTVLAAAIGALAKSAGDAVKSLGDLATESGSTISNLSGTLSALAASGASTDNLGTAFKRLANAVATDWPAIEKNVKSSADNIATSQLKVEDASLNVISSQLKLSDSAERAQLSIDESFENLKSATFNLQQAWTSSIQTMQNDALGLQSATLGVTSAQNALAKALGTPVSAAQQQQLAIDQAQLAVAKALQAQRDASQKQLDDITKSEIAIEQATLAQQKANLDAAEAVSKARIQQTKDTLDAQKAQLELNAALRSQNETLLADIPTIMREIQAVQQGAGGLAKNFDLSKVSVDNLAKSVIAVSAKGDIVNGLVKPTSIAVITQLSSLFQNLTDESTKTALALKLFGRGVGEDMVQALSKGTAATQEYIDKQTAANLIINESDLAISQKLHNAFNTLANDLTITAEKFALAFGQTVLSAVQSLDTGLRKLTGNGSIQTFAEGLAKAFQQLVDGVTVIVGVFAQMYTGIQRIVGEREAFTLLVGVFTAIGAAVLLLLSPFITWPLVIATIITAIGALSDNWNTVKQAISDGIKYVTDFFKNGWDTAIKFVNDQFKALGEYINSTWIGTVIATIAKAAAAIKSLFSSASTTATATPSDDATQGNAGGGHITGPGTSKSDSIHAMLSTGEFVVQAPAVAKLGVGFMHAINNMEVPKFAGGGYVASRAAAPSSSGSSSRTLHLTIGGQTFKGMTAPENIVPALRTASVRAQMTSNGRKAAWAS